MEGFITLIVLYIIFSMFSSFVKKGQAGKKTTSTSKSGRQASVEEYVDKLEKFLTQSQRSKQQISKTKPQLQRPKERPEEQTFTSSDEELAQALSAPPVPPPLPGKQALEELVLSESQITSAIETDIHLKQSLLSFDKRYGYIQGLIMSEILGPPVSKRRSRSRL